MKSEVKVINGIPRLFVNDEIRAPMFFFSAMNEKRRWVNELQMKAAYEHGYDLISVPVQMNIPVRESDGFDFDNAKHTMDEVIQWNPNAKMLLRCTFTIYHEKALEWDAVHPGDAMHFAVKRTKPYNNDMVNETSIFGRSNTAVTVASDAWAEAGCKTLETFIQLVENDPVYSEHVLGYHIGGAETSEWFHFALRERGIDVSETNRKKYCQYLEKKYTDISKLNAAWQLETPLSSFAEVQIPADIPGNDRMEMAERTLFVQDGDQRFIDYCDYSSELMCDRIKQFARCSKQVCPDKIVVTFYGYLFELYDARTGHFRLNELLECPDVDVLTSPVSYTDRNHGGIGALMAPVDSINAHGKLWLVENDIRMSTVLECPATGITDWVPRIDSIQHGCDVYEREIGQMLAHNLGCWYMDLQCEGWHYHPITWGQMRDLDELYRDTIASGEQEVFQGDVAVVVDERAMSLSAHADDLNVNLLYRMRSAFYRAGVSFGFYTAADVENGMLKKEQAVFYLTPFGMDDERVQKLCAQLKANGTYVITMYGFGKLGEDSVKALTGMDIKGINKLQSLVLKADEDKFAPDFAFVDTTTYKFNNNIANPAYYIEAGDGVEPLAYYADGELAGKIAVAKCVHDGITSVHCCATLLTPEAIKEVCRAAGVHIYTETRDTFIASHKYVTLHATKETGMRTIRFAEPVNAVDLFKHTEYKGVTSIDVDMRGCSTIVLKIEK